MNIVVDKLPDRCAGCIFNQSKYCVLKMDLKHSNSFVQNNRESISDDCPLTIQENIK